MYYNWPMDAEELVIGYDVELEESDGLSMVSSRKNNEKRVTLRRKP